MTSARFTMEESVPENVLYIINSVFSVKRFLRWIWKDAFRRWFNQNCNKTKQNSTEQAIHASKKHNTVILFCIIPLFRKVRQQNSSPPNTKTIQNNEQTSLTNWPTYNSVGFSALFHHLNMNGRWSEYKMWKFALWREVTLYLGAVCCCASWKSWTKV